MRSTTSLLFAPVVLSAAFAAGCASSGASASGVADVTRTTSAEVSSAALSTEQVASLLSLEASADLQRATYGQAQAVSPEVRRLADDAARDDSASVAALHSLVERKSIALASSPMAARLSLENDAQATDLHAQSGVAFDRVFLIAEAHHEQHFLDLIDSVLVPSTKDEDVRLSVAELRARASSHRHEAERLLSQP